MKDAIAAACEKFKNNVATYRRGEQLDILDFQIPGKIEYYLRMVFDHGNSHTSAVYISGDLGEAVVYPTCTPTLEGMANCFTCRRQNGTIDINESYFIEKIKTASNLYTFDSELYDCGRRVHPRIVLWLVALRLAWEQVKGQGEENDKGE